MANQNSVYIIKSIQERIYSSKGTNMNQEPGTKTTPEAEELSPAAREFSRVIAAALVKHWQQENQTKQPDNSEVSDFSLHRAWNQP